MRWRLLPPITLVPQALRGERQRAPGIFLATFDTEPYSIFLHSPIPVGDMGNAPFHKFFVLYQIYFSLLMHFGCGMFELSPIFTHFSIRLVPAPWGTREGRGDVAIFIYPHHGDPRRQR